MEATSNTTKFQELPSEIAPRKSKTGRFAWGKTILKKKADTKAVDQTELLSRQQAASSTLTGVTEYTEGSKHPNTNEIVTGLLSDFNDRSQITSPLEQCLSLFSDWFTSLKNPSGELIDENNKASFNLCLTVLLILNKIDPALINDSFQNKIKDLFDHFDEQVLARLQKSIKVEDLLILHEAAKNLSLIQHEHIPIFVPQCLSDYYTQTKEHIGDDWQKLEFTMSAKKKTLLQKYPNISSGSKISKKGSAIYKYDDTKEVTLEPRLVENNKKFKLKTLMRSPAVGVIATVIIGIAAYALFKNFYPSNDQSRFL